VGRSGRIIYGMQIGWQKIHDSIFHLQDRLPSVLQWACHKQRGSDITAAATLAEVTTPPYTNGVCPLLRHVSAAQSNRLLTLFFLTFQSIDLSVESMFCPFWMTRQSNGFSTPAPRSSADWQ